MKWRVDIITWPAQAKEKHYFKNKTAAFNYISTYSDYLYIEVFKFDGKIWKSIKIFWG
jgi:hypothetical protein